VLSALRPVESIVPTRELSAQLEAASCRLPQFGPGMNLLLIRPISLSADRRHPHILAASPGARTY